MYLTTMFECCVVCHQNLTYKCTIVYKWNQNIEHLSFCNQKLDVSGWYIIMKKNKTTPPKPFVCFPKNPNKQTITITTSFSETHNQPNLVWKCVDTTAFPGWYLRTGICVESVPIQMHTCRVFFRFILRRVQQIGESELFDTVLKPAIPWWHLYPWWPFVAFCDLPHFKGCIGHMPGHSVWQIVMSLHLPWWDPRNLSENM